VHFHGYKVGKTRVTGCLERGITLRVIILFLGELTLFYKVFEAI